MAEIRPDVGALLCALERFIVRLTLEPDAVTVEVAPDRGRRQVSFRRMLGAGEYGSEQLGEVLIDAARWLNDQPEVLVKVPTDWARPAMELEGALARLAGATRAFVASGRPAPPDLEVAMAGAQTALARWGAK